MDGKGEVEVNEAGEWELLQHDDPPPVFGPHLDSNPAVIRPDYFSLHPHASNPSSTSSTTNSSDLDRNFDDSYVASQLFNNPNSTPLPPWNDSDESDTDVSKTLAGFEEGEGEEEEQQQQQTEQEKGTQVKGDKGSRGNTMWWKVPFEVFRHWVPLSLPISVPVSVWSVAATAAFLGLVMLGRRLYKMKRSTRSSNLNLNLALDDKKVSQLMGRVARLNEAFSVVRRVPIVRPSLPGPSVATLRPVMSMR